MKDVCIESGISALAAMRIKVNMEEAVPERIASSDTFGRIVGQHLLEQVDKCSVGRTFGDGDHVLEWPHVIHVLLALHGCRTVGVVQAAVMEELGSLAGGSCDESGRHPAQTAFHHGEMLQVVVRLK